MATITINEVLWLILPVILLASLSLRQPTKKPVLEIVAVKIGTPQPEYPGYSVGEYDTAVEVTVRDNTFSWLTRLKGEHIKSRLNEPYGLYIEDENGIKYGAKWFPSDRRAYRPFVWKTRSKNGVAIGGVWDRGNGLHLRKYLVPLKKIPLPAGKLTLKCMILQEDGDGTATLPINVVVREH